MREVEADPDQTSLIRKLRVNFDELYVAAIANRIVVYESGNLKPIDVSLTVTSSAKNQISLTCSYTHLDLICADIVGSSRDGPGARCCLDVPKHSLVQSLRDKRRNHFHGALSGRCRPRARTVVR